MSKDCKSRRTSLNALKNGKNVLEQERQVHKRGGQGSQMLLVPKMGHIRCQCKHYKFDQKKRLREYKSVKKPTWVEKGKTKSVIVLTSLKAEIEQMWYFDNGSSWHMTGNN